MVEDLFFDSCENSCGPLIVMGLELLEVEIEKMIAVHLQDLFVLFLLKE
jgi:hypothetical protein